MVDLVLRLIGLGGFIAFLAVLGYYVPELNLITVLVIVAAMAIYDFLIRPMWLRNGRRRSGTR